MKTFILFLLTAGAVLGIGAVSTGCSTASSSDSSSARAVDLEIVTFSVDGMTCSGCEVGVKLSVKKLDGVHEVETSYEKGSDGVKYEPDKVTPEQIEAVIEELGYKAMQETGS